GSRPSAGRDNRQPGSDPIDTFRTGPPSSTLRPWSGPPVTLRVADPSGSTRPTGRGHCKGDTTEATRPLTSTDVLVPHALAPRPEPARHAPRRASRRGPAGAGPHAVEPHGRGHRLSARPAGC